MKYYYVPAKCLLIYYEFDKQYYYYFDKYIFNSLYWLWVKYKYYVLDFAYSIWSQPIQQYHISDLDLLRALRGYYILRLQYKYIYFFFLLPTHFLTKHCVKFVVVRNVLQRGVDSYRSSDYWNYSNPSMECGIYCDRFQYQLYR